MISHTPGPWFCNVIPPDPNDLESGGVYVHTYEATIAVCDVSPRLSPDEYRANGLLIRAAPDLLAACEQVAAWITIAPEFEGWPAAQSYLLQLRAALDKAREA